MPRGWNIYFEVGGENGRPAYNSKNSLKGTGTLNGKPKMSENGGDVSGFNLSRVANVGLLFNLAQKRNELLGSYTEDRIAQRKASTGLTFAKYGLGLYINPAVGAVYTLGDLGYRGLQYSINLGKKNREARYFRSLSGNNANSGSRYRRDYI